VEPASSLLNPASCRISGALVPYELALAPRAKNAPERPRLDRSHVQTAVSVAPDGRDAIGHAG
jgi:hypothetical protein